MALLINSFHSTTFMVTHYNILGLCYSSYINVTLLCLVL